MLNKYKELREELNKRFKIIQRNLQKMQSDKKLLNLLTVNKNLENKKSLGILNSEKDSLNVCLKLSEEITSTGMNANADLVEQDKTLKGSGEKVQKILRKVPVINQVLGNINFHKYKEKIILGIVIGVIVFIGLYLTFYR